MENGESREGRENPSQVEWVKPNLVEEMGELDRTAEELGIDLEELIEAFENGELQDLDADEWKTLRNAHSRDESWTLDEVREWMKEIKKNRRDPERVLSGFERGDEIPAPIVLYRSGEPPYLVTGNTRLLVARVKKIAPMVLKVRLSE